MKNNKKKITRIVDEISTFMFTMGSTHINSDILETDHQFIITIKSNFSQEKKADLDRLIKFLNFEKSEEMEAYYWGLTGQSQSDIELTMVGMMIDSFYIDVKEGELILTLYRNK